ncbi:uncharacterized protein L3040_008232 [Drepanopeziza brunnea f. sp. 'multigermtubi']|uniref:uncharacterized protein n=1 Tax=Drepanopeziza brunnea f. sp. 'multigermtubi' TaxID=698441 RepID=UPI00239ADDAB|nr:hypothetical protein L3040_008232 [Drepanopeziza brunnea f. sp. 'multigermtubi']
MESLSASPKMTCQTPSSNLLENDSGCDFNAGSFEQEDLYSEERSEGAREEAEEAQGQKGKDTIDTCTISTSQEAQPFYNPTTTYPNVHQITRIHGPTPPLTDPALTSYYLAQACQFAQVCPISFHGTYSRNARSCAPGCTLQPVCNPYREDCPGNCGRSHVRRTCHSVFDVDPLTAGYCCAEADRRSEHDRVLAHAHNTSAEEWAQRAAMARLWAPHYYGYYGFEAEAEAEELSLEGLGRVPDGIHTETNVVTKTSDDTEINDDTTSPSAIKGSSSKALSKDQPRNLLSNNNASTPMSETNPAHPSDTRQPPVSPTVKPRDRQEQTTQLAKPL